jgi:hypothetical protein
MTTIQDNKYNMYLTLKEFFASWIATLNLLPHFGDFHTAFLSDLSAIQNLSEKQLFNKKRKGVGAIRKELKLTLLTLTSQTADKLYAYALFIKDQLLQKELHYSLSKMKQSSDPNILKWAKGIYDRAELYLTDVTTYGITATSQLALKTATDNFEVSIPTQRISSTENKMITNQLINHFNLADQSLLQIDALMKILSATEPTLCETYNLRRKIISYGVRTMAIQGLVTDTNKVAIKGVTITFLNEDGTNLQPPVVKKSAAKGGFNVKSFAEGVYLVKLTKVGYIDLTITITVVSGELCKINVMMSKIQ